MTYIDITKRKPVSKHEGKTDIYLTMVAMDQENANKSGTIYYNIMLISPNRDLLFI
jgi:hypothetical protein